MAYNKFQKKDGTVWLDLTADTVTAAALKKGITAHDKSGKAITGTLDTSGSIPSGLAAIDFGTITISSAFTTSRQTFKHYLGVVPDFLIVFANGNVATTNSMLMALRSTLMGYRSSAYNLFTLHHANSTTTVTLTNSNSSSYGVSNMTATQFQLASNSSSIYWRAGTYLYLAFKLA